MLYLFSSDVKLVRKHIKEFFNENSLMTEKSSIKKCLDVTKYRKELEQSVRELKLSHQNIALNIIQSVSYNEVANGHNHIYRNTLSFLGREYLKQFMLALNKSIELNFITKEQAEEIKNDVHEAIKQAG